jgi:hypothetical protein
MSAIAPVVLIDSLAANRTYVPAGVNANGVAKYVDRLTNGDVMAGASVLTLSVALPTKTSKTTKVRARLVLPELDAFNEVDYTNSLDVTFTMAEKCLHIDREHLLALTVDLLNKALFGEMVEDYEPVYG